jgi:voltage-gated potassium channel
VVVVGTVGFWYLEAQQQLTLFDALYVTITTITTVGYGDIVPHTFYGRIFAVGLILSGVGVAIYVLTGIIGSVLEGRLRAALGVARVKRGVAKMKNHMIICGGGRTGEVIADEFRSEGLDFVVIEQGPEVVKELRKKGMLVVEGDATKDEVLVEAGIERASGLVSTLPLDADNLFLCITAKELNKGLEIVTRASSKEVAKRLYSIGVKKSVMIEEIGGRRLAKSLTKPAVVDFLEFVTKTGETSLESLTVEKGAKIANKKVKELRIKERVGASIVAIIRAGKVIANVGPEDEIKEGDTVVIIGEKKLLDKLEELDFF